MTHSWGRKARYILFVSLMPLLVHLQAGMLAPCLPAILAEFHISPDKHALAGFFVSVYALGMGLGAMVMGAVSQVWGRKGTGDFARVAFAACTWACSIAGGGVTLVVYRFVAGVFGACVVAGAPGVLEDLFVGRRRTGVLAVYTCFQVLALGMGTFYGAAMEGKMGWRQMFWVHGFVATVLAVIVLVDLRETYGPVLLERRAARLRRDEGNELLRSRLDTRRTAGEAIHQNLRAPFRLLGNPACGGFAALAGAADGCLYVALVTMDEIMRRAFGDSIRRWFLLGFPVGCVLGLLVALVADYSSEFPSRSRFLVRLAFSTLTVVAGLLMYGWAPERDVESTASLLVNGFLGIGAGCTYIGWRIRQAATRTFVDNSPSALTVITAVKGVVAAGLVPYSMVLYGVLGLGWGSTILALSLIMVNSCVAPFLRKDEFPVWRS
ncbi:major facilitator superfamily domain-containing protein [Staphylotrichum tortipilum]|uniref:Major facilitator superfamily domain-containing protein n=1 Tax=Staphylotrichum tortipilum TaxID=2831512 RepID=A0AAN6MLW3_9PEZI|nr:major facilitator superfamily domain-containing protein [Staphylotrichum longicolle]